MKMYIVNVNRLNNSIYGNPRFEVCFLDEFGEYHFAKTTSNSTAGYQIDGYLKKWVDCKCHFTKKNNLLIDYVK